MELRAELAEASDRIDAVGNEHAHQVEDLTPGAAIDLADTGVAHIAVLLLGLEAEDARTLFDFAVEIASPFSMPQTNFLRGLMIGALWQRERR